MIEMNADDGQDLWIKTLHKTYFELILAGWKRYYKLDNNLQKYFVTCNGNPVYERQGYIRTFRSVL